MLHMKGRCNEIQSRVNRKSYTFHSQIVSVLVPFYSFFLINWKLEKSHDVIISKRLTIIFIKSWGWLTFFVLNSWHKSMFYFLYLDIYICRLQALDYRFVNQNQKCRNIELFSFSTTLGSSGKSDGHGESFIKSLLITKITIFSRICK